MKTFSLSEQIDYSNVHQPGTSNISAWNHCKSRPTEPRHETINYSGPLICWANLTAEGSANGTPLPGYFGQRFLTNNLTGTWDASSRATLSLTYRYRTHMIAEGFDSTGGGGNPGNTPLPVGADTGGTVTINENGGIFNAALRPTDNWDVNGTVEMLYDDNAFTPVGPRQTKHYRVHTKYKPKPWATFSGAYNDLERHNNTEQQPGHRRIALSSGDDPYYGPLNHVDHSRVVSLGAVLAPNEHYGIDFNYAYSDVYAATNICYDTAPRAHPGADTSPGPSPPSPPRSSTATTRMASAACSPGNRRPCSSDWWGRDFMDAPTQYGSVALTHLPRRQNPLQYRLSHQRCERQPVLQRCARRQRLTGL